MVEHQSQEERVVAVEEEVKAILLEAVAEVVEDHQEAEEVEEVTLLAVMGAVEEVQASQQS